jgi:transposase, IS5 family
MRDADPQMTFADLEFMSQGVRLDPVLEQILEFVQRNHVLVEAVRKQLDHGLKQPRTGRPGLSAEQTILSLILMRYKNWDYRELRERIADGYTMRRFTQFHCESVPKHDAFNRAHNRLTAETMQLVNEVVVQGAVSAGLEDGEALRSDTTVIETDIHWPTDATLLWDIVRVLTRWMQRLRKIVPHEVPRFSNHTRVARRRMLKLQRMTPAERERHQVSTYKQLLAITEDVLDDARAAVEATKKSCGQTPKDVLVIAALRKQITDLCPSGDRVVHQTRRRVIAGEQVPAGEKVYSIFEPHTALIKRGKVGKPVEFGHKIFLAESAQGLITPYLVLDGNPSDEDHVQPSLQRHKATFGSAPKLLADDRGFYSPANIKLAEQEGVSCVSIPQRGGKKTREREAFEKSPDFKQGQRFRAGIEGTISVLFRGRGMKRCLAEGKTGVELLVGAAVLANNLMRIAALLLKKAKKKKVFPLAA